MTAVEEEMDRGETATQEMIEAVAALAAMTQEMAVAVAVSRT